MKPGESRELTKREQWTVISQERQADVVEVLHDQQWEIERANAKLAELYASDPEAAGEYAQSIVEYLDSEWAYSGEIFMVAGNWHMPTVGISAEGVIAQHTYEEVFTSATSNGFIVKPVSEEDGDEVPRVGLSFIVGSTSLYTPSLSGEFNFLAYADTADVTVNYLRPGSVDVVSGDPVEIGKALQRADALLKLYTNHPDSSFYRQSARKQNQFLRDAIAIVEDVLPAPDSYDKAYIHDLEIGTVYFRHNGELVQASAADGLIEITGEILGITTPDVYDNGFGTRYESPEEFSTISSGICLIVRPIEANIALPGDTEEYLLIPYRATPAQIRLSVQ